MGKLLSGILIWALSSFLVKIFATLGIAIFTYKGLYALVDGFIDSIQPLMSGLPEVMLNFLALAGVPEALSIVFSALLTRAAINAAKAFVGVV